MLKSANLLRRRGLDDSQSHTIVDWVETSIVGLIGFQIALNFDFYFLKLKKYLPKNRSRWIDFSAKFFSILELRGGG